MIARCEMLYETPGVTETIYYFDWLTFKKLNGNSETNEIEEETQYVFIIIIIIYIICSFHFKMCIYKPQTVWKSKSRLRKARPRKNWDCECEKNALLSEIVRCCAYSFFGKTLKVSSFSLHSFKHCHTKIRAFRAEFSALRKINAF